MWGFHRLKQLIAEGKVKREYKAARAWEKQQRMNRTITRYRMRNGPVRG